MLSYLRVKNFKSFSDITVDLRGAKKIPKSTAFIYGENGSGKSNLMLAMLFLLESRETLRESRAKPVLEIGEALSELIDSLNTVGVESKYEISESPSLVKYINKYKMIGSKEPMEVEYGFYLNGHEGRYLARFNDDGVIFEELRYRIEEREGPIFTVSNNGEAFFSPSVFKDSKYKNDLLEKIERYWGSHTFLAILFDEFGANNQTFMEARLGEQLLSITNWMIKTTVWLRGGSGATVRLAVPERFLAQLTKGTVKNKADCALKAYESLLNTFFTQLYTDVKSVFYRLEPFNGKYRYSLYFEKLIDGRLIEIPYAIESNGTQKLMRILPALIAAMTGATVFIDEIDNGIHDLLMKKVIEIAAESCKGQLVVTTHNTLLLESCDAKNVYSINIDANGNKVVKSIAETGARTQKTHNKRDKYLRGDYGGVPITGDFDFGELLEEAMSQTGAI